MMKKLIGYTILLAALTFSSLTAATIFCEGFETGYIAGHCYGDTYCIEPITPICPLPRLGEHSFIDGYNRGFLQGLAKGY